MGHRIKNRKTQLSKEMQGNEGRDKVIMTGTLVQL